jgi:hypothetical protein
MDTQRGSFDGGMSAENIDAYDGGEVSHELASDPANAPESVRAIPEDEIGHDERRMQVRAYNHWAGLLRDATFPSIEDLEPGELPDFDGHSVLLDFSVGIENPAIQYMGDNIARECSVEAGIDRLSDVPQGSLLSRITDHYMQILAHEAPIGFEAEFMNQRGATLMYRGILLPFSSDDETIDFIYGVINWKELGTAGISADQPRKTHLAHDDEPGAEAQVRPVGPVVDWADGPQGEEAAPVTMAAHEQAPPEKTAPGSDGEPESRPNIEDRKLRDERAANYVAQRLQNVMNNVASLEARRAASPLGKNGTLETVDAAGYGANGPEPDRVEMSGPSDAQSQRAADLGLDPPNELVLSMEDACDDDNVPDDAPDEDPFGPTHEVEADRENEDEGEGEDNEDDEGDYSFASLTDHVSTTKKQALPLVSNAVMDRPVMDRSHMDRAVIDDARFDDARFDDGSFDSASFDEAAIAHEPVHDHAAQIETLGGQDDWSASNNPPSPANDPVSASPADPSHGAEGNEDERPTHPFSGLDADPDQDDPVEARDYTREQAPDNSANEPEDAELRRALTIARRLARFARRSDDRQTGALYAALEAAHVVAGKAARAPEAFSRMVDEADGLPATGGIMATIVRLAFPRDCDPLQLAEYGAVLSHAERVGIGTNELAGFLSVTEGGIDTVVAEERRLRRADRGQPIEDDGEVRAKLARQLRELETLMMDDLDPDGPEFSLMLVRRDAAGRAAPIGEITDDVALVELAGRRLVR